MRLRNGSALPSAWRPSGEKENDSEPVFLSQTSDEPLYTNRGCFLVLLSTPLWEDMKGGVRLNGTPSLAEAYSELEGRPEGFTIE